MENTYSRAVIAVVYLLRYFALSLSLRCLKLISQILGANSFNEDMRLHLEDWKIEFSAIASCISDVSKRYIVENDISEVASPLEEIIKLECSNNQKEGVIKNIITKWLSEIQSVKDILCGLLKEAFLNPLEEAA